MTHFRVFPAPARAPRLRSGLVLAGGAVALLALVGCSADSDPAASESPSSTSSAQATDAPAESAAPSATPSPTATPAGTTVALECDEALTPDDVYAFNSNYGTAPDYSPEAGSDAATAVEYDGLACGIMNQSSGDIISIGIAAPNEVLRNQMYDAAVAQSQPVPTYGDAPAVEGFFASIDGVGEAQIFTDTYWVTMQSVDFFEPGDTQGLMAAVISHLP
ncbi:hypothetical protein E3T55_12795 [Cryobacterium frigoriphilum]|uniref:Iron ABC transporter ATP-binding protein n=1 Tax=Cryobacterium frigoriphilum TaxID=1259150 RepID=A0A4R8ZYM9_9MICO|nr:hypothetical protein [Cryobacterium frigoriphilum]TFD48917.1 hypothetical protein E3T55_12795 [Cryobacterium frigoriphilum]